MEEFKERIRIEIFPECEKFCNSLSILYSFVHGVKLTISFQTVVNEKKIGKIILILL